MIDRLLRKLLLGGVTILAIVAFDVRDAIVCAGDAADMVTVDPGATAQAIKLPQNKSVFVDLPRDARDVLISNPNVVDAVIRTPRRLYLTAVPPDPGQTGTPETNVIVFDRAGVPIVNLDVSIEQQDTNRIIEMLHRLIPGSAIKVEYAGNSSGSNIVLSGTVKSDLDARRAQDIAEAWLGVQPPAGSQALTSVGSATAGAITAGAPAAGSALNSQTQTTISAAGVAKVINLLTIQGEDQVHLKVTVAEVNRNAVKQLGVDWNATNFNFGSLVFSGATANGFAVNGTPDTAIAGADIQNIFVPKPGGDAGKLQNAQRLLGLTVRALERNGLFRTLAEPTLTAISGESASFLAGGEFPIPTGNTCSGANNSSCQLTIGFKPFGVSLRFTPVVLAEGRISLHVFTEVSELSNQGSITLAGTVIPGLQVRRAETTMELPSGGALVMGGLLQDDVRQSIAGLPGLQKLPVLGALFRSRDYQRNETELVIIVTPYLVEPVARTALARPDDGFAPASDATGDFLGRINRVYGAHGKPAPAGSSAGKYGFIFE